MDNELFLNATTGLPPSQLQYDHSASISTWHTSSSSSSSTPMVEDIPTSHHHQSQPSFVDRSDCLFDSTTALKSNLSSSGNTMGDLIGQLGSICGGGNNGNSFSGDIVDFSPSPYVVVVPSNNNPLSSPPPPPKSNTTMMDRLPIIVNDGPANPITNFPNINLPNPNSMRVGSAAAAVNLPAMPGGPGFAERAARFSSFGSRSFNGRNSSISSPSNNGQPISHFPTNNNGIRGKLQRVLSSPALHLQQVQQQQSHQQTRFSGAADNSRENSSDNLNSRKRKSTTIPNNIPSPSSAKMEKGGGENCPYSKRSKSCIETEEEGEEKENGEDGANKKQRDKSLQLLSEEPSTKDYIHVRARRGQATDSHSLAERVRREKISERMKLLQDLVPGCNKVIGKALMLEEIINYVQSLQRQVEFLSMKLASVNTKMEYSPDQHPYENDMFQPNCLMPQQQQQQLDKLMDSSQQQSRMTSSSTKCSMEMDHGHHSHSHGDITSLQTQQSHLLDAISDSVLELQSLCESDLQTIVQMGLFNRRDHQPQSQSIDG